MSRFLSLLFVSLLAVSQTDAQLATKSLANDLVIATEGTIVFTELSGKPLIGTLYQQALVNIGRFDDAIAAFGPESIDARLLNRICFEMTRNGRQDAIKMLYEAQQASSTPLDEKDFSKLLAPGLKCGQLLRAVEASEFEVALALVDELKQVATTTSIHAAVRSTDEVFRELAVHSIDHGLIDQAISFVKRAKGKADVANCALSFANRDKDDAVFEFLRKLKNIDPQIAMSVASRFIGSNEKFVSRNRLPLAQSRASKARAAISFAVFVGTQDPARALAFCAVTLLISSGFFYAIAKMVSDHFHNPLPTECVTFGDLARNIAAA